MYFIHESFCSCSLCIDSFYPLFSSFLHANIILWQILRCHVLYYFSLLCYLDLISNFLHTNIRVRFPLLHLFFIRLNLLKAEWLLLVPLAARNRTRPVGVVHRLLGGRSWSMGYILGMGKRFLFYRQSRSALEKTVTYWMGTWTLCQG